MENKALEALNELLDDAKKIKDEYSLGDWKNKATNLLIRIYGNNCLPVKQVENMTYTIHIGFNTDNVDNRKLQAQELIRGLIKEITRFGLPDQVKNAGQNININITQAQSQDVKVSLSLFIEAIQEELTGGQLKELQALISDTNINTEDKKSKIIIILNQFGSEISTNIMANVLTHPMLFGK